MRASTRFALAALALGIVGALAIGEGMARVAAWWSPAIRELAVPAREREPRAFASLEAYLASKPTQVVPHRNWFNYWNNALGLNSSLGFNSACKPASVPLGATSLKLHDAVDQAVIPLLPKFPYLFTPMPGAGASN